MLVVSEKRGRLGLVRNVQRVDDTRNVTQDGEQDVDAEVGTTSSLEENTKRREDDGKNDLADVATRKRVKLAYGFYNTSTR